MKTLAKITSGLMITVLTTGTLISMPSTTQAQSVSVSLHIPAWAPAYDNTSQVRYYYMPDIEAYYDVFTGEYIYLQDGIWIHSFSLPPTYSTYDPYNGFVVLLDYGIRDPWTRYGYYHEHYPRYYYRDRYHPENRDHNEYYGARGYNENQKKVVYSHNAPNGNNTGKNVNNGAGMQKAPTPQQAAGRQQGTTMQKAPTPQQAAGKQQGAPMQKAPTPQQAAGKQSGTNMQKAPTPQQAAGRQQSTPMQKAPTPQQAAGRQQSTPMQKAPTPQQAAGRQQSAPMQKAPTPQQAAGQQRQAPPMQQRQAPQQPQQPVQRQAPPMQQRQAPQQPQQPQQHQAPAPAPGGHGPDGHGPH